jgi:TfoX/Sxy family transcriptional regulator of competence genes
MPFNPDTLSRICQTLDGLGVVYTEKRMFSGVCILVDDKMLCGTHIDKKTGEDVLLVRIGETAAEAALEEPHVIPMDFTGKSMKGFVYVLEEGIKKQKNLKHWLQKCLDYNPVAKSSRKKVDKVDKKQVDKSKVDKETGGAKKKSAPPVKDK